MLRAPLAAALLAPVALSAVVAVGCDATAPPPMSVPPTVTGAPPPTVPPPPPGPVQTPVSLSDVGLDAAAMDKAIDPCQDFFQYACGGWLKTTEIPSDRPLYSRSFSVIAERNEAELKKILEEAQKAATPDAVQKKIGAYYGACMDETAIEKAGPKPLAPLLAIAKKVTDKKALTRALTELHKRKIWAVFDTSDTQDFKDATKVIAELDQNGLGLPDRDYYTKDDEKSVTLRKAYVEHVERMLVLTGFAAPAAKKGAEAVMHVETEIAKISKTRVERRDPKGLYNRITREALTKLSGDFDWNAYFKGIGFPDIKDINLTSTQFFEGFAKLIGAIKPAEWQAYLSWHAVRATSGLLPKAFVDEQFTMEKAITGQKEQRPRWKRCVAATDGALGELVGQAYVKSRFSGESKQAMSHYVEQIGSAFAEEVTKLDWMDDATKKRAVQKLKAMENLIGYPAKWRAYDFDVKPDAYAENALASRAYELKRALKKVGQPLDRGEWSMSPPTVNAYYNPSRNHMVFPAGILQPPFYNPKANAPVNLGAIGMVVGHELTHGFDDQGAQFDDHGNLVDWWSPEVAPKFKAKTGCIEEQYGSYEPLPGVKLNGKLTLGENIADNAGLKLAYNAYRSIRKGAAEVLVAEGMSEDQQFFLGTAQAWCVKETEQIVRMRAQVDPHSPGRFRVNGPMSNMKEFSDAFQCKEGTPMKRAKPCDVW
jgi:predicted metalloendopeptidase